MHSLPKKLPASSRRRLRRPGAALAAVLLMLHCGCATSFTSRKEALPLAAFESELQRGVATMADVKRRFGPPDGVGGACLPSSSESRVVWFYDKLDVEIGDPHNVSQRQDAAIVFFRGELLDGFLWFHDSGGAW